MTLTRRVLARVVAVAVFAALAPVASGQSQTLLFEDFEDGLAGWNETGNPGLWHAAPPGECGAVSTMAACNQGPAACDYAADFPPYAWLRINRDLGLLGPVTHILEFDYLRGIDPDDHTTVWLGEHSDGIWTWVAGYTSGDITDTGSIVHRTSYFTLNNFWWFKTVTFEFEVEVVDPLGNQGLGWMIDNVRVSTNAFTALEGAKGSPPPKLEAVGPLRGPGLNRLTVSAAQPGASARLVLGFSQVDLPHKGGVLVPEMALSLPLTTDAAGSALLEFSVPPGVPAGLSVYFQAWIVDPDETFHLAASNGVLGITS